MKVVLDFVNTEKRVFENVVYVAAHNNFTSFTGKVWDEITLAFEDRQEVFKLSEIAMFSVHK